MGVKRIVDTDFWTDPDVIDKYACEDKYFMLYLLTNPHTKQCGIYSLPKKYIVFELGKSKEVVEVLIQRFEDDFQKIIYNTATQEISILNSLKYSVVKGGTPVEDCIRKELSEIKDKCLIEKTYNHLTEFWKNSNRPFDQNIKAIFEEAIKKESSKERTNDNDNDNDNDNEESYPDSLPIRENPAIKPLPKKTKHKYGQYENVLLTDEDLEKLKIEFSDWSERIERLSEYMASKGESYKNHLATIRSWSRREQKIIPKEPQTIQELMKGIAKNGG